MSNKLGRLVKVELRDIWQHEANDFTPWLARDENIALLGEVIGYELEVEATERAVGPFNADILCKDTVDDHWVLIENQLERTDHTHLGQLLTYAAGLNTMTIVWIAKSFTEEHRAALDWLNEITMEGFSFFGIEVELWQIGESPIAPNFKLISKPNDWVKSIGRAARKVDDGPLSEAKALQLEYWTGFYEYLQNFSKIIRPRKPRPQHWSSFAIGRSGFHLSATTNTRDGLIGVSLIIHEENGKAYFHLLHELKDEIEAKFGEPLDWQEKPDKQQSWVYLGDLKSDPWNREDWNRQYEWLCSKLESLHTIFSPLIKDLDADDFYQNEVRID